jgi:hypothetical protein
MTCQAPVICFDIVILLAVEVVIIDLDAHVGPRRVVLVEERRVVIIEVLLISFML